MLPDARYFSLVFHERRTEHELGFVPLSKTGAELLFEILSQRYERGATVNGVVVDTMRPDDFGGSAEVALKLTSLNLGGREID